MKFVIVSTITLIKLNSFYYQAISKCIGGPVRPILILNVLRFLFVCFLSYPERKQGLIWPAYQHNAITNTGPLVQVVSSGNNPRPCAFAPEAGIHELDSQFIKICH